MFVLEVLHIQCEYIQSVDGKHQAQTPQLSWFDGFEQLTNCWPLDFQIIEWPELNQSQQQQQQKKQGKENLFFFISIQLENNFIVNIEFESIWFYHHGHDGKSLNLLH